MLRSTAFLRASAVNSLVPIMCDSDDYAALGFKGFPLRTFVSFVVNGFALPMTRDLGDYARLRAIPYTLVSS